MRSLAIAAGSFRRVRREAVRRRRRAGFTMIEMLGVIVILGLIATLVSMNWRAIMPRTELQSATRLLANMIQGAHSEAIARNSVFRIEYDLDNHRYRLNTPYRLGGGLAANDDERVSQEWTALPTSVRFARIDIDGIEYRKGMVFVRFDPLGAASGHVVTLEQEPYKSLYTIEVEALTGMIAYHEGTFERVPPRDEDFK